MERFCSPLIDRVSTPNMVENANIYSAKWCKASLASCFNCNCAVSRLVQ